MRTIVRVGQLLLRDNNSSTIRLVGFFLRAGKLRTIMLVFFLRFSLTRLPSKTTRSALQVDKKAIDLLRVQ